MFDLGNFLKKKWDTSVVRDAVSSNTAADQQRRQVAAQKAAPVQTRPNIPYYGSFSPQVTNQEQAVQQTGRDLGRMQREGQITGQQFNDKFSQLLASTTKDSNYKTPIAQAGNFAKSIVKPFWETGDTVVKGAQLGVANATNNTQAADNARLRRDQSYQDSIVKPVAQAGRMVADTPVGYLIPGNSARKSAEKQNENKLIELRDNTESFTQNKAKEIQDGIRAGVYDPQKAQAAIQELLAVNESANARLGQFYDDKLASQGLNKDMTAAQAYATAFGNLASTAGLLISPASGTAIRQAGGNVVRRGIAELGTNSALNALGGASSAYGQGADLTESLKAGATQAGIGAVMMGAGYLKGLKGPAAVETNIPAAPNSLREQIQVAKNNVRLAINNPDEANVFKVNNPLDAKTTGLDINNPMGAQTKPLDVRNPMGAETGKKLSIMDRYRQATDIDAPNQDGALFPKNDAPQVGKTPLQISEEAHQAKLKANNLTQNEYAGLHQNVTDLENRASELHKATSDALDAAPRNAKGELTPQGKAGVTKALDEWTKAQEAHVTALNKVRVIDGQEPIVLGNRTPAPQVGKTDPLESLKQEARTVEKFGWKSEATPQGTKLINKDGKHVATITEKNGRYTASYNDGRRIATGADANKLAEDVARKTFYAQEMPQNTGGTLRPDKTPEPFKNTVRQGEISPERAKTTQANVDSMKASMEFDKSPTPKKAFHSTASLEIEGGKLRASSDGAMGEGVYLHTDPNTARYAGAMQGDGNIADQQALDINLKTDNLYKWADQNYPTVEQLALIKKRGYDGVYKQGGEIVVFDPNKIELSKATQPPKSPLANDAPQVGKTPTFERDLNTGKMKMVSEPKPPVKTEKYSIANSDISRTRSPGMNEDGFTVEDWGGKRRYVSLDDASVETRTKVRKAEAEYEAAKKANNGTALSAKQKVNDAYSDAIDDLKLQDYATTENGGRTFNSKYNDWLETKYKDRNIDSATIKDMATNPQKYRSQFEAETTPVAQVGKTPKKEFTPISQPVDNIPAIAKRVAPVESQTRAQLQDGAFKQISGRATPVREKGLLESFQASNAPQDLKDVLGAFSKEERTHLQKSNKKLWNDAQRNVYEDPVSALDYYHKNHNDESVARGYALIERYNKLGDTKAAGELGMDMAERALKAGRETQAYALMKKMTPQGIVAHAERKVAKFIDENPKLASKINFDENVRKDLADRVDKITKMDNGRERNIEIGKMQEVIDNIFPSSIADKAITLWKAGLLTSLRTHERNIIGNAFNGAGELSAQTIGSPIDRLMALRTGKRTTAATLGGYGTGSKEGAVISKDLIKTGVDTTGETLQKHNTHHITWGNGIGGKFAKGYTQSVFRTLGAEDKPFRMGRQANSMHSQALAEASNLGLRGAEKRAFVNKFTKEVNDAARQEGKISTFAEDTAIGDAITKGKSALKERNQAAGAVAEAVVPFSQVPASVATQLLRYSPAGLAKGIYDVGKVLVTGNPELQRKAALAFGRGATGTAIMGAGALLMSKGLMTGDYPTDPREKAQWELERKQPNSIMVGGKWKSINSVGPQTVLALAGGKVEDELSKGKGTLVEKKDAAINSFGYIGKQFSDQTFVKGLTNFTDAFTNPNRKFESYVEGQVTSVIPNIVKDVAKGTDSTVREISSLSDKIKTSIPGLSGNLTPQRDVFGNEIKREGGIIGATTDLFNSKTPQSTTTIRELDRIAKEGFSATPARTDKNVTIGGEDIKLEPKHIGMIEAVVGPIQKKAMVDIMNSPNYSKYNDQEKSDVLKDVNAVVEPVESLRVARDNKLIDQATFEKAVGNLNKSQIEYLKTGTIPVAPVIRKDKETNQAVASLFDKNNNNSATTGVQFTPAGKTKAQSEFDVASSNRDLTMTRAKANNDLNAWNTAAAEEYDAIGQQIKALDPKTDQVKINTLIKKQEALQRTALGYKTNGYIKKTTTKKAAKGSKGSKFTIPTTSVASSARTSTFTNLNRLLAGTTKTNSNKGKIGNKVALRKITVKGKS